VVGVNTNGSGTPQIAAFTDSSSTPTTYVGVTQIGTGVFFCGTLSFIVLPGNYYEVSATASAGDITGVGVWIEWN
jgi:hypothetical protein